MRSEFKNNALIVIPETAEEVQNFQKLFPQQFMKNSRYVNVRQFVDIFGNPETDKPYLLINGIDEHAGEDDEAPRARRSKVKVETVEPEKEAVA